MRSAQVAAPKEATGFDSFGLHPELVRAVFDLGFTTPTPVQVDAIPAALNGQDVLACAMTGSGKTAAFLLPILHRLRDKPRGVTRALILTPTRELAAQIVEHLKELAKHSKVRGAAVYGGVGMGPQIEAFRKGVDVLVATPGRLLDHFQHDYARLDGIDVLVIDEADRMLDMGFLPDIRRVLKHLPRTPRQTLFFSATMPAPIQELSRELLRSPTRINLERKQAPATGITQAFYPVPSHLKVELLAELLTRGDIGNAIVFCRTKHRANRLAEKLERQGMSVARIHGNRSQSQRTEALTGFKDGRYRVLVATDIVARGIDVEALDHVVNFDVPNAAEDYIHRVGRTARADATGDAYTLVSPDEENEIRSIERALGHRIERRTLSGFDYTARAEARFEVPIGERIAAIRARKSEERARARAKAERKTPAPVSANGGGQKSGPVRSGGPSRNGLSPRSGGGSQGGAPRRRSGGSGSGRRHS
jgi:ATP-dependent RNA helicase RhlE